MPVDVDQLVGRTLAGRYRVVRPIGHGGMGAVFEAVQLDLERRVAIKILFAEDPRAIERFRQEALATGNLVAPNVVAISDFCEPPDGPPFIVMELLEGEALSKLLARESRLAPARAVGIALQVLTGLSVAHATGVFHRDIKPANIFLTKTAMSGDLVKVLDFGIAKVAEGGMKTTTGAFMGTPSYLAPEQITGEEIGAWTDTRAVGVVLFEMLAGVRPWVGEELLPKVLSTEAPPLTGVRPELAAVVARALAREPAARFTTAEAMMAALQPFAAGEQRPVRRTEAPGPRARWPLFAVGFAVPVIAGVGVLVAAATGHKPALTSDAAVNAALTDARTEDAETTDAAASDGAGQAEAEPTAPPPSAKPPAVQLDDDCLCVQARTGTLRMALCPQKMPTRCSCEAADGERICSTPHTFSKIETARCPVWDDYGRAGAATGDGCTGFVLLRTPETILERSVPGRGTLSCSVCYGRPKGVAAVHGNKCVAFTATGQQGSGVWDCSVRRTTR